MFPEVSNFLGLSNDEYLQTEVVGICENGVDGSFLIHHFLSAFLKTETDQPVCFVSFHQSYNHYNSVGSKTGGGLNQARDSKKLLFIDGVKLLGDAFSGVDIVKGENSWRNCVTQSGALDMRALYEDIESRLVALQSDFPAQSAVLIIDNISTLLSCGVAVKDIGSFLHYCTASDRTGAIVVSMTAEAVDDEACLLWKNLQHMSTLTLAVSGLQSGYCRDVHGQLTARWNTAATTGGKGAEKETQFKLTDKSVRLFASGMSAAVL